MREHFIVPAIRSREVTWAQRSRVGHCEDVLQPLDLGDSLLSVHDHNHLVGSAIGQMP